MGLSLADWAAVLAAPLLAGAGLLRCLGITPRSDPLAWLGWAWVTGTLASGLVLFAWLCTAPDLGAPALPLAALVAVGAAGLVLGRGVRPAHTVLRPAAREARGWERALFAAVVVALLALTLERALEATLVPVLVDDEAEFWALRAKVLLSTGGFGDAFAAEMGHPTFVYNKDYPLLNPLLQLWTYVWAGDITHVANRVPIQLFAPAQLLIVAAGLRRLVRPTLAAALLVCLVALPETRLQAGLAQGDLMVGLGALVALDAWLRGRDGGGAGWTRLAAVGLALLVWSKNEGQLYAAALVAGAALPWLARPRELLELRPGRRAAWLLLPLGVLVLHRAVNAHYGFSSGFLSNPTREGNVLALLADQLPEYLPVVASYYGREILLDPWHSNLALLALLATCLVLPSDVWRRVELRLPALAIVLGLLGVVAVFLGAPHEIEKHLRTAADRVSFQLVPATFLWLAVAWGARRELSR